MKPVARLVHAAGEIQCELQQRPRRHRRHWLLAAASLFLAGALGALAVNSWWPHPDDPMLHDLPVLLEFDQYEQIGDIHFLHRLKTEGMFVAEPDEQDRPDDERQPKQD